MMFRKLGVNYRSLKFQRTSAVAIAEAIGGTDLAKAMTESGATL